MWRNSEINESEIEFYCLIFKVPNTMNDLDMIKVSLSDVINETDCLEHEKYYNGCYER